MANRYWVGGTAAWDGTAGSKWALTSGGAGGQAIPTTADDVFFDAASGASTVTISTGNTGAKSITCTGFTGTLTGTAAITVAGSVTLVAGMTYSHTAVMTFTGTGTLTTAGKTFSRIAVNGAGITLTLGDALTAYNFGGGDGVLITQGTFTTNNYNVTIGGNDAFNISGSSTRTVNLGSSTITIPNIGGAGGFWEATTTTNLTFNAGTSTIVATRNGGIFNGGGLTYYNVTLSGVTSGISITGANTFNTIILSPAGSGNITPYTFSANQTINGTLNCSAATDATSRIFVNSDTIGTARTLTCAAVSLIDIDFRDIAIAGAAAPASGTRLGDCKGNSGITFAAAKTVYWNLAGAQNWPATGWATSSGGSPSVNNFPLAQDTAVFNESGSVTGTININLNWNIGTIDMSARTSAMTLSASGSRNIYGNWINGSGTTISGTGTLVFLGRGAQSITSAAKTFTQSITINSPSGTVTLQDALTLNRGVAGVFTLNNGTLDLNGKTLTLSAGTTATFATGTGTKNLTFNGGSLSIATSGGSFNNAAPTGFTTTAGTGTGSISLTSASAKTFVGGGSAFNCSLNQGGAGALIITGANTFNNITNTYSATGATTITFGGNQTVTAFTATGASGSVLTLNSDTVGTQRTIALTGGGTVTTPNYLNVQDLSFTPFVTDGTSPYNWYAGANSTNSGNNRGILFAASTLKAYLLESGSSWTVPGDWNNSSNNIYLIGGGGGGGGSRATSTTNKAGGGGGGGGGFTALTNQTLSGSVSYSVGSGGTAGTSGGGTGGTGGTTTFNAQTATGGGGGSTTTTPTSVGGSGGTGNFTGGTGGAGATTTSVSVIVTGGGGGGAAGPNGNGGNGGIGFGSATASSTSGGGGGGNGGGSAGGNGSSGVGGTGGNNSSGTGGGASNTAGTVGGGGGGGVNSAGKVGGAGIDISNTVGGGGGSSGSAGSATAGVTSTAYGAGGSGGSTSTVLTAAAGGAGGPGMIFIIYTPSAANTGNFFFMF